jgi:hypothetical protein
VSAKRYVLFNLDRESRPVIRKASAHGLGHLLAPYEESEAPASIPSPAVPLKDIGVERWQYDLWYRIVQAVLDCHPDQVNLSDFPGFNRPAVSRYGATTPVMLRWFRNYNDGKSYREQVKPFNFLLAYQAQLLSDMAPPDGETPKHTRVRHTSKPPKPVRPVAPFDTDRSKAIKNCFDRETGAALCLEQLKTHREALAQYHLHPETKFLDADYLDRGPTRRRHIKVAAINLIGKEADRLEEQVYLGLDPEAEVDYGIEAQDRDLFWKRLSYAARAYGVGKLATAAAISRQQLWAIIHRDVKPSERRLERMRRAIAALETLDTMEAMDTHALSNEARRQLPADWSSTLRDANRRRPWKSQSRFERETQTEHAHCQKAFAGSEEIAASGKVDTCRNASLVLRTHKLIPEIGVCGVDRWCSAGARGCTAGSTGERRAAEPKLAPR